MGLPHIKIWKVLQQMTGSCIFQHQTSCLNILPLFHLCLTIGSFILADICQIILKYFMSLGIDGMCCMFWVFQIFDCFQMYNECWSSISSFTSFLRRFTWQELTRSISNVCDFLVLSFYFYNHNYTACQNILCLLQVAGHSELHTSAAEGIMLLSITDCSLNVL